MNLEERLRARLHERADVLTVPDAYGELMDDVAQGSVMSRRAIIVALAFILLLGSAGGFLGGRLTATPTSKLVASGQPPASTSATGSITAGPAHVSAAYDRLFIRTTHDHITIRAYRQVFGACRTPATPCPPAPNLVILELSNDAAISTGNLVWTPATSPGGTGSSVAGAFGVTFGQPAVWIAAQVGPAVARVRVRFADGATDEMRPVDGIVGLAHGTGSTRITIETLDGSGHLLDSRPVPGFQGCYSSNPGGC